MANSETALLAFVFIKLRRAFVTFFRLILTFILISVSPALAITYGFVSLYRLVISKVAKYFDPSLGKMMSAISNLFAAHDVYGNSFSVNVALHVVGNVDRCHIIHAMEKLFSTKLGDSYNKDVSPLYPELRQKIVSKFGFTFWKNVENFKIEDHIHYLNPIDPAVPVTLQDIRKVIAKFGKTAFNPERSPWAIYIVKNFANEENLAVKSALIIRLHHCMFDGYSVLNLFSKLADNGPLVLAGQQPKVSDEKLNTQDKMDNQRWWLLRLIVKTLMIFFVGPYVLVGQLLSFDNNKIVKTCRNEFKAVMRFSECDPMQLNELKMIKNYHKVTFNGLVTTMMVRAVKEMLEKRNVHPKKIHMTFPIPVVHHPDKLRNYFSGGIVSFDMQIEDRIQMLRTVERKLQEFRSVLAVGLPEVSVILLRLLGSLPNWFVPGMDDFLLSSTLMFSSFPGPVDLGYFCGFPIVDATVGGSISKSYPVGCLCFSYKGVYKIAVSGDTSVFSSQEEIDEVGQAINKEFVEFLRKVKESYV